MKTINERLIETRKKRELTQIEAAAQIGVSLPTLRTWEQGMPITAKKIPIIEKFINGV